MTGRRLETDYLVVGSGAMGMAFSDEILTQNATDRIVLVDQHAQPGGHWNDGYSFVRLHQPAAYYGVNSEPLGSGGAALASRAEIRAYYERVLHKWVDTGRLQYFPLCEYRGDGVFRSLVEPELHYEVEVRKKLVDATYMKVQVPSTRPPPFPVAADLTLVPPNALPGIREPRSGYVVIGGGKTGIDAVLFLLDQQVDPGRITWIVPNDAWLLPREALEPGRLSESTAELEGFARAQSLKELFEFLEAENRVLRISEHVWPTKYRCATVNSRELSQLRRVENVVRRGRVLRIESAEIVLEHGSLPTDAGKLHVDCTADGLAKREIRPVFSGGTITLQSLFVCQQVFSSAVIGLVESRYDDESLKNALCQVVQHPEFSGDFVAAMLVTTKNMDRWVRKFGWWLRKSRLSVLHHDSVLKLLKSGMKSRRFTAGAAEGMQRLLVQEFPDRDFSSP